MTNNGSSDRVYWRVGKSSAVMSVVQAAVDQQKQFSLAMGALEREYGGKVWLYGNSDFCGVEFHGDIPSGWRKTAKSYAVPDKRKKAGREIEQRIKAIPPGVDPVRFSGMLSKAIGLDFTYWGNGHIYWTILVQHGDAWVIGVPAMLKVNLPGCQELKMSEYWALREACVADR